MSLDGLSAYNLFNILQAAFEPNYSTRVRPAFLPYATPRARLDGNLPARAGVWDAMKRMRDGVRLREPRGIPA
jgi:hypothetical protein